MKVYESFVFVIVLFQLTVKS